MSAAHEGGLWSRIRLKFYAFVLIGIIVGGAALSAAAYNRAFTSSMPVTLEAARAGLQMHPGNRVKIRGVDLGLVRSVELNPDQTGATISLDLDPTLAADVPANVTADLAQLTAFGNKTIQMEYPVNPSSRMLTAGSVIRTRHVSTELNNVFEQLTTVLNEIQPQKLNATLGSFAQALNGRGESLGQTLVSANQYLTKFNGNLPQLQRDFRSAAQFTNLYADAAPDLVRLLGNSSVTARTLADKNVNFGATLSSLDNFGGVGDDFFDENAAPLTAMLRSLRPTTTLLKKYSPMLTCFLQGAGTAYDQANRSIFSGGMVHFQATFTPGGGTYQNPRDLPHAGPGPGVGPSCHGLPYIKQGQEQVMNNLPGHPKVVDRKSNKSNTPQLARQPLVVQLFGPEALLPPTVKGGK